MHIISSQAVDMIYSRTSVSWTLIRRFLGYYEVKNDPVVVASR